MKPEIQVAEAVSETDGLPLRAALFSVFLCSLFGANAVAMKLTLAGLGPFTTAGLRFGVAAVSILCWALATGRPMALRAGQFGRLAVLGPVFFVQLSLFYHGMTRTSASHGTLIANLLPFVVMLLAHLFIPGDRISLKKITGLLFGFSGVLLLLSESGQASAMLSGDLLILAAVMIWGINGVYTKRIIPGYHPVQVTFYPMALATPCFFLSGVISGEEMVGRLDFSIICGLLYQTFVTASFGMVAWNAMIRRYGASSLHAFVFIMPISGVLLGILLLGEPFTPRLAGAVGLVVAGLLIVNRKAVGRRFGPGSGRSRESSR